MEMWPQKRGYTLLKCVLRKKQHKKDAQNGAPQKKKKKKKRGAGKSLFPHAQPTQQTSPTLGGWDGCCQKFEKQMGMARELTSSSRKKKVLGKKGTKTTCFPSNKYFSFQKKARAMKSRISSNEKI
jgi:hypothetical protein